MVLTGALLVSPAIGILLDSNGRSFGGFGATDFGPRKAEAAVSDWQKGVSIFPSSPEDFNSETFRQSLGNVRAMGANYATFVIPIYQADNSSSDIFAGGDTPSDQSLIAAINYAHSLGMKVMLKPHLGSLSDFWRAHISASDRDSWFTNYGNMLLKYAAIAQQTGVEGFCIGTELISMATYTSNPDNTQRWEKMISDLRNNYSGFVTYSANWGASGFADEAAHIGFWPSLDFIGLSAYYTLSQGENNPSIESLMGSWQFWDNERIKGLASQYGKPILFTEIGYRSVDGAHNMPFEPNLQGNYNPTEQVNDYEALFRYWKDQPNFAGIHIWNWYTNPNAGGEGDKDYTPQNKPAEQTIKGWFTGGSNGSTPGDSTPGNGTGTGTGNTGGNQSQVTGDWTIVATAPNLLVGQSSNVDVTVGNSGQATNVIVDVEIYDSGNNKVFQKFFEAQSTSVNQSGNYTISWAPPNTDAYILKVGIFNSSWSTNYHWNDSVLKLQAGIGGASGGGTGNGGNGGTGTGPVITDIWWPTDGSIVSGLQPFKAMLTNKSTNEYSMYWQVDGDRLNVMENSDVDYPHKEALVDLSGWNWRDTGPYVVNFVSKDGSGNVIGERAVQINVTR